MNILLTNDDGIEAPGLAALVDTWGSVHTITVVAPDRERSAVSQGFSFHVDYRVQEVGPRRFSVGGTPVDCAMFALSELGTFDLVVSGINRGANLAWDTWYSGTVGAASEAARRGVKSLAVSLDTVRYPGVVPHFNEVARELLPYLDAGLADAILPGHVLNMNFPNDADLLRMAPVWAQAGQYTYNVNHLKTRVEENQWIVTVEQLHTYPNPDSGTDGDVIRRGPTFSLLKMSWPDVAVGDVQAIQNLLHGKRNTN